LKYILLLPLEAHHGELQVERPPGKRSDVSTILNCSGAKAWNEVQKSSLLIHVIWPLARVIPVGAPFPQRWSAGLTVQCKSFIFGLIPIGVRTLHVEKVDH
jgi:hypothetical protein